MAITASPSQFHANSFLNPVRVRRTKRSVTVFKGLITISKYEMQSPKGARKISTTSSSQSASSRFIFVAQGSGSWQRNKPWRPSSSQPSRTSVPHVGFLPDTHSTRVRRVHSAQGSLSASRAERFQGFVLRQRISGTSIEFVLIHLF